jgi:hypothetical protein
MPIRLYGVSSSGVKRKKLLFVLLSSKMPSVIHQLSVLNREVGYVLRPDELLDFVLDSAV